MRDKIKALYEKHGDLLRYLIIGGLTTLLTIVLFALLNSVLGLHYQVANIIVWILAVAFAFWGNKQVVFRTKSDDKRAVWREAAKFLAARLITLGVSTLILYIGVDLLGGDETLVKVISTIIEIILNYILSKLIVFRTKES